MSRCSPGVGPDMSGQTGGVRGLGARWYAGVEPPGHGVGAWMWVNRKGLMDVVDMDLAGGVSGFTLSSVSLVPDAFGVRVVRLADWGIP